MSNDTPPVARWDGQQWVPLQCTRCNELARRTYVSGLTVDRSKGESVPLCERHFAEAEAVRVP